MKRDDEPWQFAVCVSEADTSTEGWTELFVAELPEPDGWADAVGDEGHDSEVLYWNGDEFPYSRIAAFEEGIEFRDGALCENLAGIRSDALKMLAAAAACEEYRAERAAREATT